MIFVPYPDEQAVISRIHQFCNEDYCLIRLSHTMVDKNIIDARGIFRTLVKRWGIVDYSTLKVGLDNRKVRSNALFIQAGASEEFRLSFYRVKNDRGDPRFSISAIKLKNARNQLFEQDLLYFSVFRQPDGTPQMFMVNLTHNTPSDADLRSILGYDAINALFNQIKPRLNSIIQKGYVPNSKGIGPLAPKDIGDTFESLLGIATNNRTNADINGLIEIKTKGESNTLDTLFTLRPHFEGTRVAEYEPNDRNRVSAFARLYGYESEKHPDAFSLYCTIGPANAPQNNQGFYLIVDDRNEKVDLIWTNPKNRKKEIAAFWYFEELQAQLYAKHPSTLWIEADVLQREGLFYFKYTQVQFSRAPQFTTFLSLIKEGKITYDWRGYVAKSGPYVGKNHGNAWRIKPSEKSSLFGEISLVEF